MSGPKVHVLAPVHNRRAVTERFIGHLLAQTYRDWHLVLIDDGSDDGTADMARAALPQSQLTILRGRGDWWWAGSLQQGYLWIARTGVAADDLVLMINDDTEFGPEFLSKGVAAMRPKALLLAQSCDSNGQSCEAGVFWDWKRLICTGVGEGEPINCFSTRGLFLHAGDFLKIGGFFPKMLPHYLSDYEFTIRAHRKGYALISSRELSLRYFEALTGIRSTRGLSVWQSLKTNLSIKSTANPIYWTSFVLLACPARYVLPNLVRVWWGYLLPVRAEVVTRMLLPVRRKLGQVKRWLKGMPAAPTAPSGNEE